MRAVGHHLPVPTPNSGRLVIPIPTLGWPLVFAGVHLAYLIVFGFVGSAKVKTVVGLNYIMLALGGAGRCGRDFSGIYFVSSQAVASGPPSPLLKIQTNSSYFSSGKADVDLRRKPACHWTPREQATGSLKHLFLTFFPPTRLCSIPSTLHP